MPNTITLILGFMISQYIINWWFPHFGFEMDDYLGIFSDYGHLPHITYVSVDNVPHIFDVNSDDPNKNIYDRKQICTDIRLVIDDIKGMMHYKEIRDGYYWNEWRSWFVEFRTKESYQFERYLNEIYDNCEN